MSYFNTVYHATAGYSISHYDGIAAANTKLHRTGEFLGLTFNLCNDLSYESQNLIGIIRHNHYNIFYLPAQIPCDFTIQKEGRYTSVNIQLTENYLRTFATEISQIESLFTTSKNPLIVSKAHLPITSLMRDCLNGILNNQYTGTLRDTYLNTKVTNLVILCLKHIRSISSFLTVSHPQLDITKIEEAHSHLLHHLESPCSVSELADLVNLDRRKLEKGFKLVYGNSLYSFYLRERMKKALNLLKDTTFPVSKIARKIGYRSVTSFSQVFKKEFGYPPIRARHSVAKKINEEEILTAFG